MRTLNTQNENFGLVGKSAKRLLSTTALTAAGLVAMAAPAKADGAWTQWHNTNGNFTVNSDGTITDIVSTSSIAGGHSNNLDILAHQTVNVQQNNSASLFYGIAANDADPTQILGGLNSNGQILISDVNGVFFGSESTVDVSGLIATTGSIADEDILDGDGVFNITNLEGSGSIINEGNITVAEAGLAGFVAPTVVNNGVISAKLGTVALAAGDIVTLDLYGDSLVEVAVEGELADALIENKGMIVAEGGQAILSASAAKDAVDNVINMEGTIDVSSFSVEGGNIVLSGGDKGVVNVSGSMDASGTEGGNIAIVGEGVIINETAELKADAGENGDGGNVRVWGDKYAIMGGSTSARGGSESGNGGFVELSAGEAVGFAGHVDASAPNGERGTFLIDPEEINLGDFNTGDTLGDLIDDILAGGSLAQLRVDDGALAGVLRYTDVNLWATDRIFTSSDFDVSVWNALIGSDTGITDGDLTLSAPTIDIDHNITMGNGDFYIRDISSGDGAITIDIPSYLEWLTGGDINFLGAIQDIDVNTVNLNAKIQTRSSVGGPAIDATADRIDGEAHIVNIATSAGSINQGIQFADGSLVGGADVNLGDDTWNEAVVIDRSLNLNGDGTTNTTIIDGINHTGTGIHVIADDVSLNGIIVENFYYGIGVDSEISNLAMDDIVSRHNGYAGLHVANTGGIDGLDVMNSHFDDNDYRTGASNDWGYGWYFAKGDNNAGNTTNVTNVTVTDTTFSRNSQKGIYAEKLDNASFTNVDVIDSGTWGDSVFGNVGIDLNLKNGSYENIAFNNLTVTGSGLNSASKAGIAVSIKGRNDGATYSITPGTLTGLEIKNSEIVAGGDTALDLGNGIDGADIKNSDIAGSTAVHIYGGATNALVRNNTITADSVGVLIENASGNKIRGNTILTDDDGVIVDNSSARIVENTITGPGTTDTAKNGVMIADNDTGSDETVHVLRNTISGFGEGVDIRESSSKAIIKNNFINGNAEGVNIGEDADGTKVTIYDNDLSGNTKGVENRSGEIVNASFNWWGSNDENVVDAYMLETNGGVDFSPYQGEGTDTDLVTKGYQGNFGNLWVTTLGAQTDGLIQEAVDAAWVGGDINVNAGTYEESVDVWKSLNLYGANKDVAGFDVRGPESIVTGASPAWTVNADNVVISGFTMDGPTLTYGVLLNDVKGVTVSNNIISRSSEAGIGGAIDSEPGGGTLAIVGNKIDDSNTGDGINIIGDPTAGDEITGVTVTIANNEIGTDSDVYGDSVDDGVGGRGIVFEDNITNRIDATDIRITSNEIRSIDDGIQFNGTVGGDALVYAFLNDITAGDGAGFAGEGVDFNADIQDNAFIYLFNNEIDATGPNTGIEFEGVTTDAVVALYDNAITAGSDGILVNGEINDSHFIVTSGTPNNSSITAGTNGINFQGDIIDSKIEIDGTTIDANGGDGVVFAGVVDPSTINIGKLDSRSLASHPTLPASIPATAKGNDITGSQNGISFEQGVTDDSTVNIVNNANIEGEGGDGVSFGGNVDGDSTVNITDNHDIIGDENGIAFDGTVTNATVNISRNNDGISANDHGILFAGAVSGSDIDIHDNIISANEDNGVTGSGIWFDSTIGTSTVSIGDGNGSSDPSNFITVGGSSEGNDGIHFDDTVGTDAEIEIDGNRIGYTGTPGNHGSASGDRVGDDGIQFSNVESNANIVITDNHILADDDGVQFGSVNGTANILVGGEDSGDFGTNYIETMHDGVRFLGAVTGEALIEISENEIDVDNDGVVFLSGTSNALGFGGSEEEILIANNDITGGNHGIRFAGSVSGERHDIRITGNDITGNGLHGIAFNSNINDAEVRIHNNSNIHGDNDGIYVAGLVENNALVEIIDNTWIEGQHDDAIDFGSNIESGSVVRINSNDNIRADNTAGTNANNGIEFFGVNAAKVEIIGNNHGIHANDHGIFFGNTIFGGADIDIHDNIISATEDGGEGDGIHFAGTILGSTINIGDGTSSYQSGASNIINGGNDGIHFGNNVNGNAQIAIDGNRIGYNANSVGGTLFTGGQRMGDDGIQFTGSIAGNADIDITDNWIRSEDDGVSFTNGISGNAMVLIGGVSDGNVINANDDGIEFDGNISGNSRIQISNNDIDADENGIQFDGTTSNADTTFPYSEDEILISYNDIEAGENGIAFFGEASGDRHDIMIRDNVQIHGHDGDGIHHTGNINGATLWIQDNDDVYGSRDGMRVTGYLYNDGIVDIRDNTDVDSGYGDGIYVEDYSVGSVVEVNIVNNHVHNTGDDGIYAVNLRNLLIDDNEVHNTGGHGIYASNSDNAEILNNTLWDIDEHGILVNPSDYVDIIGNNLTDVNWDGIHVDGGIYAWIEDNTIFGEDQGGSFAVGDNGAGRDGIHVDGNWGVTIVDNNILGGDGTGFLTQGGAGAGRHGIYVDDSPYADINGNTVQAGVGTNIFAAGGNAAESDGIHVEDSRYTDIFGNRVDGVGRDGIDVDDSRGTDIGFNRVRVTGGNGIEVTDSRYTDIFGNFVSLTGENGIDVHGSRGVDIFFNGVFLTSGDGIHVGYSRYADVQFNLVGLTGDDGIDVHNSHRADINNNAVFLTDGDGIQVRDSNFVDINDNFIRLAGDDGIDLEDSFGSDITGNNIRYVDNNGIEVEDSSFILIDENTVMDAGLAGIFVDPSDNITVSNNTLMYNMYGVHFDEVTDSVIENNTINENIMTGILIENSDGIDILNNTIFSNGVYGVHAAGGDNGYINISGNNFLNNPTHGFFESGLIDLTGPGNLFQNGKVALHFSPFGGDQSLLRLVDNDGPGSTPFGSEFPPTNFAGTLGSQTFMGQTNAFVKLDNNAFFVGGKPLWLNALDSTYLIPGSGFVTPATSPYGYGILTLDQFNFLESMFQHFPDLGNVGVFFFGFVPGIADEDAYNYFGPANLGTTGLNVTILGLPGVGGAQNVAGISPFAGGDEGEGGPVVDPQALNDIQTAAGESETSTCLADSIASAAGGAITNYSYDGSSLESILTGEASCQ